MSGAQTSSFYPVNQLLADNFQQIQNYYAPQRNQLLIQKGQQEVNAQEMEFASRAALGLLNLPDEAAMAAAYPGVVAEGQRYGFLKNAPSVFPGKARLQQIASWGVPAEKQYERQANIAANMALIGDGTGTGTTTAPGATVAATPGPIEGDAQARAFAVRDGLIRRGMDPDTATAFAANALHESSANPNVGRGDRGSSAGLFQWRDDRERAYIAKYGHSPQNAPLDEQLDFVMHELGGSESVARDRINSARGVGDKAAQVSEAYLRPKDTVAEMQRRSATALQLAGALPNVKPGMTDQAWLDQMARQYPSLGGPNANLNQPNLGTPAPYQTASLTPTPPPSGATPAAPAQPPATTTAQGAAPAQPAPAPAVGFSPDQRRQLVALANSGAPQSQVIALQNQFRDENTAAANTAYTRQRQAEADARAQEELGFKRAGEIRAQSEEIRRQDEAKRQALFQGATPGMMWNADHTLLVPIPGYTGATDKERMKYNLDHGDPNSADYAADYAAMKWQTSQAGNVIENDMSMYRPPAMPIQRPTYLPQPSPQALEDVRKVVVDSQLNVGNIDHYIDVLKRTDGATINTFFNNPRDPRAQSLLGAFTALKMTMRGPSAMNTGVLQPHEQVMLKDDLVSPDTVRALGATVPAIEARLHEIKLSLLRKADLENRSVGKEGVIMHDKSEVDRLPSGTRFYDTEGNLRIKP